MFGFAVFQTRQNILEVSDHVLVISALYRLSEYMVSCTLTSPLGYAGCHH